MTPNVRATRFPPALVAVFILLAAGIIVAGYVYYDQNRQTSQRHAEDQLNAVADLKAQQVSSWRDERLSDARFIFANREIATELSWLEGGLSSGGTAVPEWMTSMYNNRHYEAIVAFDTLARPLVGIPSSTIVEDSSLPQALREAALARQIVFTDFHAAADGYVHLDVIVPVSVRRGATSTLTGYIVLRINPATFLFPTLQRWPLPAHTSECILFRAEGDSVVLLSPLRHSDTPPLRLRVPLSDSSLTVAAGSRGFEGVMTGRDYRGHTVLSALRRLAGSPWTLEAKIDVDELAAPVAERGWLVTGLVIGLILAAGTTVVTIWRKSELDHLRRTLSADVEREALVRHFDYLTKHANDIILLADAGGRIIESNDRAVAAYGRTAQELAGMLLGDLGDPSTAASLAATMRELDEKGSLIFESLHRRNDGSAFPVEISTRFIEVDGKKFQQAIIRDITERKKAEESIRRLNRVYSVLSNVNEAIVRIRDRQVLFRETCRIAVVEGRFAMAWIGEADPVTGDVRPVVSDGRVEGYLDEIKISVRDIPEGRGPAGVALREGKHVVCNDTASDERMEPWRAAQARQGYRSLATFPIMVKDVPRYVLTLYADVPGFFDDDEIRLLDELALDLSYALEFLDVEREKGDAIAQLRQVQKMESLGTLAGGIAHDFNNILGIILGHITFLEAERENPALVTNSIEAITKATQRGASLVRQILTFARKTDVALAPLSVNGAVEEIARMLRETFPRNIDIVLELALDLPPVTMDHTQLHQALLNLCVNARDAIAHPSSPTSRKGKITIATCVGDSAALRGKFADATADEYIGIRVADTGPGMDEQTKQRVFEPFFTTKEKGKGTGLGLAVVYGVVQGHRGLIDVETKIGAGTTFTLWFPSSPALQGIPVPAVAPPEAAAGGSETLLFVEDEESLLSMMRLVLEDRGYTVITARDGMEAVRIYTERRPEIDLVISDLGLPKLDGVAVTTTLRELNPGCRVVLATGYLDPEVRARLAAAGVTDYLAKPYVPVDMLRKIREVLDRREQIGRP